MQKIHYLNLGSKANYSLATKDEGVVGSYEKHNDWKDYTVYLIKYINESFKEKIAMDFACGPGRNIILYKDKFKQIDGCDISETNLENCKMNLNYHKIPIPNLYLTNGKNCGDAPENTYDFIFSTISLQHICVYDIRFSILKDIYRILKHKGRVSIQMGFGKNSPQTVGYYENYYNALGTNRACDTRVDSEKQIQNDLEKIGFKNFEYWIRPCGPGDMHPNWIFFTALKI